MADLLHLPDRFFDRIDRKNTLIAIGEIREILPETPGEKRIEEELKQAKRLENIELLRVFLISSCPSCLQKQTHPS